MLNLMKFLHVTISLYVYYKLRFVNKYRDKVAELVLIFICDVVTNQKLYQNGKRSSCFL